MHAEKSVSRISLSQLLLTCLEPHIQHLHFKRYALEGVLVRVHLSDGSAVTTDHLVEAEQLRPQLSPQAAYRYRHSLDRGQFYLRRYQGPWLLPLLFQRTLQIKPS